MLNPFQSELVRERARDVETSVALARRIRDVPRVPQRSHDRRWAAAAALWCALRLRVRGWLSRAQLADAARAGGCSDLAA